MNPAVMINQMKTDGITLSLNTATEKISFRGGKQAIGKWMPVLREHKVALTDWLKQDTKVTPRSEGSTWARYHLAGLHKAGFSDRELFGGQYPLEEVIERLPASATVTLKGGEVIVSWENPHGKRITQRAWPDGRGSVTVWRIEAKG